MVSAFVAYSPIHFCVFVQTHLFFTTFLRVSCIVMSSKLHSSSGVGFFFFSPSRPIDGSMSSAHSYSLSFEKSPPYIYVMNLLSCNKNNGLPSCIIYPQITFIKSTHIHTISLCPDRRDPEGRVGP